MEEKNTPRETCDQVGSPVECYHRQKQVESLVKDVDCLKEKFEVKINKVKDDLSKRIEKLEKKSDEQDHTIENKINDLDKNFSMMFERNNTVMSNLTDMLGEVKSSYKIVGDKIQDVSTKLQAVQNDVNRIEGKVSSVEAQVHEGLNHVSDEVHSVEREVHDIDNKGKMDVVEMMRDQTKARISPYLWLGGGAGIVAAIWAIVQQILGVA